MTEPEGTQKKCTKAGATRVGVVGKSPSRNNRRGRGCPERIQPLYLRAGAETETGAVAGAGARGCEGGGVKGSRVANV